MAHLGDMEGVMLGQHLLAIAQNLTQQVRGAFSKTDNMIFFLNLAFKFTFDHTLIRDP